MNIINILGQKFGRLVVIERSPNVKGRAFWRCLCDCGNYTISSSHLLRQGKVRSCGCLKREETLARFQTHGMTGTPELQAFYAAKTRCNNPNQKAYKDYGGRGIKFLYKDLTEFLDDVGRRPSSEYSLGRKNNDGNYEPGNCQWETRLQQFRNRRVALISEKNLMTWFGESEGMKIWEVIQNNYLLNEEPYGQNHKTIKP